MTPKRGESQALPRNSTPRKRRSERLKFCEGIVPDSPIDLPISPLPSVSLNDSKDSNSWLCEAPENEVQDENKRPLKNDFRSSKLLYFEQSQASCQKYVNKHKLFEENLSSIKEDQLDKRYIRNVIKDKTSCSVFHETGKSVPCSRIDSEENSMFITQSDSYSLQSCLLNNSTIGLATQLKRALQKNAKTKTVSVHIENTAACETYMYTDTENELFYELPIMVKGLFKLHQGITELYDWQKECLSLNAVKDRRNLVYSLPTSGGKTLVAEILALKELICRQKNVLFIFPFVCIVQEKVRSLSSFALDLDFVVEEYAAGKGQFPPRRRRKKQVAFVATIEKAHMLVNSLIEEQRIEELGLVVVDELHMIFDGGDRGADLEMTLTKLKLFADRVQIIGMSATISRYQDLAKFLKAEVYKRDFRPVELKEYVKVENKMWSVDYQSQNQFNLVEQGAVRYKYSMQLLSQDPDHLVGLVSDVIPKHSCLIFCPTKKQCQNLALMLCQHFPKSLLEEHMSERRSLLVALMAESGEVCSTLRRTVPFGVAYHNSGLTMDERKLIEEAYSCGTLNLLTCTSTLAAGVNLPAKRVIVRAPYVGASFLSASQYKQMVGRAGRAGLDSSGESILILKPNEFKKMNELLCLPEDNSSSSLFSSGKKNLEGFLLSIVGLKLSQDVDELKSFVWESLYGIQNPLEDVMGAVEAAVDHLQVLDLLSRSNGKGLCITSLGKAVVKSGLDIQFCQQLKSHLTSALKCISLLGPLHLLYLVTPFDALQVLPITPHIYYSVYTALSSDDQRTAALIGVPESCITHFVGGRSLGKKIDKDVVHRFYLTLALYELWQQSPLLEVTRKFCTHKGSLHNLLTRTAAFAGTVCRFTQELPEFWALADLLPNFVKQLQFCCQKELLPLMEIPAVKQGRARQMYRAGYKTLVDVARAEPAVFASKIDHMPKGVARQIVSAAKMMLLERAEALQDEAEELMEGLLQQVQEAKS